jgi:hypothetical protein
MTRIADELNRCTLLIEKMWMAIPNPFKGETSQEAVVDT